MSPTDAIISVPEDGIVTLDNGIYKVWFARNYQAFKHNTLLLDNALATMGAGLPSATLASLIYPERSVVSVNGDGSFMMNSQEIETAIRLNLNLVGIILNDSAYGMIKWKQAGMGFGDYAFDFRNPDFVKYAASFGAKGYRVKKTSELKTVIEACLKEGGVHVVDVYVCRLLLERKSFN